MYLFTVHTYVGVEKVTDENNEPAEDGDDTLEEKLSSEMSQPGEDSNGQDKEVEVCWG